MMCTMELMMPLEINQRLIIHTKIHMTVYNSRGM